MHMQCVSSDFFFFLRCLPGAGFLLQAEGARLPDEERAGSFGNHPAEPAMVGHEPGLATEMALTPPGLRSIQRCLHYSRTASPFLQGRAHVPGLKAVLYLAGRGVGWSDVGPASCIY